MEKLYIALLMTSTLFINTQLFADGGYWTDASGDQVKTASGECWAFGKPADDTHCHSMKMMAKKAAPAMTAAPAMAMSEQPVIKEVINLKGVTFKTGSDIINSSSNVRLNISAVDLKRNPDLKVIVAGHTDNVGDALQNLELSQKRAEAVKAYLVEQGVDASRLTARGYGDTEPATVNDTAEGRAKNRRVELRVH